MAYFVKTYGFFNLEKYVFKHLFSEKFHVLCGR